jgi:pimeloyl-ACP methyl ester carboxylesterase
MAPESRRPVVPEISPHPVELYDDGGRLEAIWIGPAPDAAPTLIFLHEGLGCVALWRDIPARLVKMTGCGALVYSRRGYGGSAPCALPRPIEFMHHEGQGVLPQVIAQCGIRDHILIGHSDGGSIALINAGDRPAPGLAGVVTLAAHVFCEEITRRSIQEARRRYLTDDLKLRLAVYHGANTECAFWGWNDVWLHPDFGRWNIEEFLPGIRVPVLAIQGLDDPYGSMAQVRSIRGAIRSRVDVEAVADCGHAPHLEQSDIVLPGIRDFVQRLRT